MSPVVSVSGSPRSLESIPYTPTPLSVLSRSRTPLPHPPVTVIYAALLQIPAIYLPSQQEQSCVLVCDTDSPGRLASPLWHSRDCPVVQQRQYVMRGPCRTFRLYLSLCPSRIPPQHCLQDWSILWPTCTTWSGPGAYIWEHRLKEWAMRIRLRRLNGDQSNVLFYCAVACTPPSVSLPVL